MTFVVEVKDYTNSWMIPYGQTLLIKHLLIIPLLVYATINSLLIKKKLIKEVDFDPRPWTRIESIVILLIFSTTAALGQQSPPHETVITNDGVSKLFFMFYQGKFYPEMTLQMVVNSNSLFLMILAVLLLVLIILTFKKKVSPVLSFFLSLLFVISSYLSLILSIPTT